MNAKLVREYLDYDPNTGIWRWKKAAYKTVKIGTITGASGVIGFRGKNYRTSRLAWLYMKGRWPRSLIDHKDTNPKNCRWENLRPATYSQNRANSPIKYGSKTKFKGVTRVDNKFTAKIGCRGVYYNLGVFNTAEAAHVAYCEAAKKHFGEFARFS